MGLKRTLFKQFSKPTGNLGRFVGWLMSFKNKDRSDWTYENLKLKPTDILLEVGYGPGVTIKKVADHLTTGFIAGIDHSEIMLDQASRKNRKHIESKKVKLECGTVWDLKYPENYFDTVFGSNVHFFWKNPQTKWTACNGVSTSLDTDRRRSKRSCRKDKKTIRRYRTNKH
jgi:hypothetical protein